MNSKCQHSSLLTGIPLINVCSTTCPFDKIKFAWMMLTHIVALENIKWMERWTKVTENGAGRGEIMRSKGEIHEIFVIQLKCEFFFRPICNMLIRSPYNFHATGDVFEKCLCLLFQFLCRWGIVMTSRAKRVGLGLRKTLLF